MRLVQRAEMPKGLALLPKGGGLIPEGYLSCNGSLRNVGVSTPCLAPQARAPELERDTHITPGYENQQGFCPTGRDKESARDTSTFIKGQHTKISFTATHSGLHGGRTE